MGKELSMKPTGTLKGDVEAICKATNIKFTNLHESVDLLRVVIAWAQDTVPRLLTECGLKSTKDLLADVAALKQTVGVKKSRLPKELYDLCEAVGVKSDKDKPVINLVAPIAPSFWPSSEVLG